MVSGFRIIILGVCGLITSGCYAFIYEIKVLRKWNDATNGYQYFIGCSDFHDKRHDATESQLEAIQELLRSLPRTKTKVIVEDLSTENNCGRRVCGRFFLNSRGGILGGLAQKCQSCRLEVDNIEYRYCRVIALGPLLHNLKADVSTIPSLKGIRMQDIMQEMQGTVDEITKYNDGEVLTAWYRKMLKEFTPQLQQMQLQRQGIDTMADYIAKYTTLETRLKKLKYLLTFDSALLDALLMHSVQAAASKERIVAFAGGTHIARVVEMLKKMGYQEIYGTESRYFREHDLDKCLGSHITDGNFCVRPHAVKNEVFKRIANPEAL